VIAATPVLVGGVEVEWDTDDLDRGLVWLAADELEALARLVEPLPVEPGFSRFARHAIEKARDVQARVSALAPSGALDVTAAHLDYLAPLGSTIEAIADGRAGCDALRSSPATLARLNTVDGVGDRADLVGCAAAEPDAAVVATPSTIEVVASGAGPIVINVRNPGPVPYSAELVVYDVDVPFPPVAAAPEGVAQVHIPAELVTGLTSGELVAGIRLRRIDQPERSTTIELLWPHP
jgi:hypothetical protein